MPAPSVTGVNRIRDNCAEWPSAIVVPGAMPDRAANANHPPRRVPAHRHELALPETAALELEPAHAWCGRLAG